jgi:rhodanese-related sulfurtransferase
MKMKTSTVLRSVILVALLGAGTGLAHAADTAAATNESTTTGKKEADKPAAPKLTRAQVDELLAKPGKVVVVDLRRPDEHQSKGTLPVYLSIQLADLEKYLDYIPRDRAVVPVSNHASRAGKAADVLVKHGFKVPGVVGVEDYEAEGGVLSKIVPPPPKPDAAAPAAQQR